MGKGEDWRPILQIINIREIVETMSRNELTQGEMYRKKRSGSKQNAGKLNKHEINTQKQKEKN